MIIIAITFVCFGLVLRYVSIKTLKGNFYLTLESPFFIVKKGIYKYIRHPSYLGSLLIILGLSLLHPAAGIMSVSFFFFMSRIVEEEKILMKSEDYKKYKKSTGMLLPKIRR